MQFFIVHDDPKENARLLPDYAILKVNVREGWQILSDIAHNVGVSFPDQNKPYSIWHAETRRFMVTLGAFDSFVRHYKACLLEYVNRSGKEPVFMKRFFYFLGAGPYEEVRSKIPGLRAHPEFVRDYMLAAKSDKMRPEELERLKNIKYSFSGRIV